MRRAILLILGVVLLISQSEAATKVDFDSRGDVRIDGKPFFPIGIWVYSLNPDVMADLHEHRFNTILGNGFGPADLPLIEKHGMMCIAMSSTDEFIKGFKDSPSLLGWYLQDEPEEHGLTPPDVRKMYDALKAKDKDHPAGITHDMLIGPEKYNGSCDFTMTDVYPITAKRDFPISAVGEHTDKPREIHGSGWPNFTIVQTFGGPVADGGKWAVPTPSEVRCMVFQALVHRANGIMYFSYWPQAPQTWASITDLNRDIERITPWLLADGEEVGVTSDQKDIEVRARKLGESWIVIAVNNSPRFCEVNFKAAKMPDVSLSELNESHNLHVAGGSFHDRLAPFEGKIYLSGDEPAMP